MNKFKATLKNLVTGIGYQVLNIIVNFLLTPLILNNYGSSTNGLVQTVRQIVNYIQFVGAGISESTIVSLYSPLHENNKNKINSIVNASGKVFFKTGNIFTIISIIFALLAPLILDTNLSFVNTALLVVILSVGGVSEFYFVGKYRALLTADQKLYVINLVQSAGLVFSLIGTYIGIKFAVNIVMLQLFLTIGYILRVLILIVYIKRKYSYLDKRIEPSATAMNKRGSVTIHQLTALVTVGSQIIVINVFLGNSEASVYSVYALIFTGISTMLSTFSSSILSFFGKRMISGDVKAINKIFDYYENFFYLLVFAIYTVAILFTIPFLKLYIQVTDVNYYRFDLVVLFAIMGVVSSLKIPGTTIILAAGHYKETQYRAILEMIICIVMQFILVFSLGLNGIVIATICAYLYRTVDVIIYSSKMLDRSRVKVYLNSFVGVLLVMLICNFTYIIFEITSYTSLFLISIVYFFVILLCNMLVNMTYNFKLYKRLYSRYVRRFL